MKRSDLIKLVAIAKTQLGMDEDSYREMLRRHGATLTTKKGGKQVYSATSMGWSQLDAALSELKAKGFQFKAKPRNAEDWRLPRINLVRQLWRWLHEHGQVRNADDDALQAFCSQHMQAERLEWATSPELNKCVEALKSWKRRTQ
ncbi:regulatory protein GemA [Thiothrix nivea]|uniref:Regulatory protein GemA n=1 Tax=Thiothrix nivea (strain ATCC 35100 / DSM 5205 / JP2) TaxID=870187 RepID=A0A656HE81_THINJ|nr:regulatory protein GemA [Thiothrix nivea]EIJ33345.1 protein of unknown function DUF1018 [Thiothrix nivea DSM 5205]